MRYYRQHQHPQHPQRVTSKCAAQRLVIADANRTLEVAVCNDKRRERHLYTSAGNDVTVFVQYSSRYAAFAPSTPAAFILHYQGIIYSVSRKKVSPLKSWNNNHGPARSRIKFHTHYVTSIWVIDAKFHGNPSVVLCNRFSFFFKA